MKYIISKKYFIVFLFLFISTFVFSQTLKQKIQLAYEKFENDVQMKYGVSSISVLDARSGEVIFSKNPNFGLASASTLKTITAATAYHFLGKDYTWETSLAYNGTISADGILNGDLIINGAGDPTLGSDRFDQSKSDFIIRKWIDAITRLGIKKINGALIADDRLYGTQSLPGGWTWKDIGNYYGAGTSSLTWRENQFGLRFKAGARVGDDVELIAIDPKMEYLKIVNEVKTGPPGSGDNVYAYSAPYSSLVYVRGTYGIDLKKEILASVPDPAFDLVNSLFNRLNNVGIKIDQGATTARLLALNSQTFTPSAKIIDIHSSPNLDKVVYWFNQKSINLYGEHLLKAIAQKEGKDNSTPEGVKIMKKFWKDKAGIDEDELNIYDGSGLSPSNRVTTLAMAKILQTAKTEVWFQGFYESLPTYNNMKMKSGSIADVIAYAGYQTSSDGTPLVFSFIINNYSGSSANARQKIFTVLNALK